MNQKLRRLREWRAIIVAVTMGGDQNRQAPVDGAMLLWHLGKYKQIHKF